MTRSAIPRGKLTDDFCRKEPSPAKGNKLHRCAATKGLALRVTSAGHKAFVFCYSAPDRRERRMTIGDYGTWSLAAARKRVGELARDVDLGNDPLEERSQARDAMTVRDLWEWYSKGPLLKLGEASQRDIERTWSTKIEPIIGPHRKLDDLKRAHVQGMVDRVTEEAGPYAANRCHSYLRRMLNLALAEEFVTENVATRSIQRNQERPRERYLSREEITSLFAVLEKHPNRDSANAIRLLLLTGARRSEVLGMRWDEVDFTSRIWTKPPSRTKQKRIHRTPLSNAALEVLAEQRQRVPSGDFVFPGGGRSGHISNLKRCWKKVSAEAGIENCRIHDLRHSFASIVASGGGSLEAIGAMLGHSQAQTTKRYAHLFDDTLREAAEMVASVTYGAGS